MPRTFDDKGREPRCRAAACCHQADEWHDDSGNWYRSYGNENWEFDPQGLMQRRIASINDRPISASERKYHWPADRRPDDHPTLGELNL